MAGTAAKTIWHPKGQHSRGGSLARGSNSLLPVAFIMLRSQHAMSQGRGTSYQSHRLAKTCRCDTSSKVACQNANPRCLL